MSKYAGTELGPTWEDVYTYIHDLEGRFDKVIKLEMRLFMSGKPPRLNGSCVATARPKNRPAGDKEYNGFHGFRGQSGAKTAPAGFYLALADLEGALMHIEKVAQGRMPF